MEAIELMNKEVGTQEQKKLEAKTVKIASINILSKTKEGKDMKTPLAQMVCIHPDKKQDDLIHISKVKFLKGEKVITAGFWVQLDDEENIQKGSSLNILLDFLNKKTLKEIEGCDVETCFESEDSSYLCIKAY